MHVQIKRRLAPRIHSRKAFFVSFQYIYIYRAHRWFYRSKHPPWPIGSLDHPRFFLIATSLSMYVSSRLFFFFLFVCFSRFVYSFVYLFNFFPFFRILRFARGYNNNVRCAGSMEFRLWRFRLMGIFRFPRKYAASSGSRLNLTFNRIDRW